MQFRLEIAAVLLAACCAMTIASAAPTTTASLSGLAVEVTNQSEPVLCAEKDNVAIAFQSSQVKSFRIEAAHPPYIGTIQRDSFDRDPAAFVASWTYAAASRFPPWPPQWNFPGLNTRRLGRGW